MSVPTPALFFIVQIIPNRTIAAKNMSTGKLPIVAGGILLSCWATNTFSLPLAQTTMTGSVYLTISLTGGWERSIMIQCIIFNITIKWGREPLGCGRGGPNICRKRILKWVLIRKPSVWPWVLLTSCIWYFFGGLPSQRRHSQWGSCSRADRFPVRVSGLGTLTSSD